MLAFISHVIEPRRPAPVKMLLALAIFFLWFLVPMLAPRTAVAAGAMASPGDHTYRFIYQGSERQYLVHVPASYPLVDTSPSPVAMVFHGGGGSMDHMADDRLYGLITQSDRSGYVLIFPNGHSRFPTGKFATWNAGTCCGLAQKMNVDDVGFVRAVLADVAQRLNIDRHRIFATGISNGAMMSYRLACEMADTFKAIAAVAGTDGTGENCHPSKPISILHIHAKNDDHIPFEGGQGSASLTRTDFVSVPATVAKWVALNACQDRPQTTINVPGATCEVHRGCKGASEVGLCVTDTGGHSWPGGKSPRAVEPASTAISANEVIWRFFDAQQ